MSDLMSKIEVAKEITFEFFRFSCIGNVPKYKIAREASGSASTRHLVSSQASLRHPQLVPVRGEMALFVPVGAS